jgi:hypothetical protein
MLQYQLLIACKSAHKENLKTVKFLRLYLLSDPSKKDFERTANINNSNAKMTSETVNNHHIQNENASRFSIEKFAFLTNYELLL